MRCENRETQQAIYLPDLGRILGRATWCGCTRSAVLMWPADSSLREDVSLQWHG